MDNILLFVAIAAIVAIVVGSAVFRRTQRTKNTKQIKQFAQERNWHYEPSNNSLLTSYPQLYPFYVSGRSTAQSGLSFGDSSMGDALDVLNFKSGEYSGQSFTYTYVSHDDDSDSGSSATTHFWHIVGLELPVPFPNLIIRRRRKLELPQARLTKRIKLPAAELNQLYSVHGEHPPAVLDMMTPEMVQWLSAEKFQNEMVMQDRQMYVYNKGRQQPGNIDPMLEQLNSFLSRIPEIAWQKAQGEYPRPARVHMSQSLDLGKITDAYKDWRDSK